MRGAEFPLLILVVGTSRVIFTIYGFLPNSISGSRCMGSDQKVVTTLALKVVAMRQLQMPRRALLLSGRASVSLPAPA